MPRCAPIILSYLLASGYLSLNSRWTDWRLNYVHRWNEIKLTVSSKSHMRTGRRVWKSVCIASTWWNYVAQQQILNIFRVGQNRANAEAAIPNGICATSYIIPVTATGDQPHRWLVSDVCTTLLLHVRNKAIYICLCVSVCGFENIQSYPMFIYDSPYCKTTKTYCPWWFRSKAYRRQLSRVSRRQLAIILSLSW